MKTEWRMLVYEFLHASRGVFEAGRWDDFEREAVSFAEGLLAKSQLERILTVNLQEYRQGLRQMLLDAHMANPDAPRAWYWEFDPDNGWSSAVGFSTAFSESDPTWAELTQGWVDGPSQNDLERLYRERGFSGSKEADGATTLTFARTFSELGRAYDQAGRPIHPLGAAFHDASTILVLPPP